MDQPLAWVALGVAGLLDVAWAISMKYAAGYTRLGWSLLSLALLSAFVFLIGRALQVLPVGTAYAVWTGVGAVGTVLAGVALFREALTPLRLGGIALVLAGIVLLPIAGALWARTEPSRWAGTVLAVAAGAVGVMIWRLQELWEAAGG